jgi:hypothetical protein
MFIVTTHVSDKPIAFLGFQGLGWREILAEIAQSSVGKVAPKCCIALSLS